MLCFESKIACFDTSEHLKWNKKLDSCVKYISGGKKKEYIYI